MSPRLGRGKSQNRLRAKIKCVICVSCINRVIFCRVQSCDLTTHLDFLSCSQDVTPVPQLIPREGWVARPGTFLASMA
jgi:hypothetical protein